MSELFTPNDGSRPSLLEKGRTLTGEQQGPADPTYEAEVRETAKGLAPFDWEVLSKAAARVEDAPTSAPLPARSPRRWWQLGLLVPVLAAVAALLLFVRPPDGPGVRAKGDVSLEFIVDGPAGIRPGVQGEAMHAGDRIQFTYRAPGHNSLVLLSIDGEGKLSRYQPEVGEEPLPIIPGERHVLERSLILDDAPGPEIFVGVFGAADVQEAEELVEQAWERGGSEAVEELAESDPAVATVRIEKAR